MFYCLAFSPAVMNPRAAALWTRGSSRCQKGKLGWAGPLLSLLFLCLSILAGIIWGKKPHSSPPQLQCVRAENWRTSVWSCACQHHGDHTDVTVRSWLCVLRQENMLLPRSVFVHGKPHGLFQKRLSDTYPPKRKKEVLKGGIWGEEVTHGLKERWAGSNSRPRQQKRSPTVPSRGNGGEEGAEGWGSWVSGTATVLRLPPGHRIFNASHHSRLSGSPMGLAALCLCLGGDSSCCPRQQSPLESHEVPTTVPVAPGMPTL